MFRLPIVKFFSRILNRITITVVLAVSYTHLTLPTNSRV